MRKSRNEYPATRLNSGIEPQNPPFQHDERDPLDNQLESRLQRAMAAVDADPDGLPTMQFQEELAIQPADSPDDLMERELLSALPSKFEWESKRLDILCHYGERDIETVVETLKGLSLESESPEESIETESTNRDLDQETQVEVDEEAGEKLARTWSPPPSFRSNDTNGTVYHTETKTDIERPSPPKYQAASYGRLLHIAPPVTLLLVGGVFSGMYATTDWLPEIEPPPQQLTERVEGLTVPTRGEDLQKIPDPNSPVAARVALANLEPQVENSQPLSPIITKKSDPSSSPSKTLASPSADTEKVWTLQQRLDNWETDTTAFQDSNPLIFPELQLRPVESTAARKSVDAESGPASASPLEGRKDQSRPVRVIDSDQPALPVSLAPKELPGTESKPERPVRQSHDVELALNSALGLGQLSSFDRGRLKQKLVLGECTTTALSAVFKKVPILAIRDLRRSLGGHC